MASRNTVEVILDFQARGAQVVSQLKTELNQISVVLDRIRAASSGVNSAFNSTDASSEALRRSMVDLTAEMERYRLQSARVSSSSNDMAGALGAAGGAIAAAFGGGAAVGAVKETAEDILLLSNRAELLTMSMSELAAMQSVAFKNGNIEEFEEGLKNLSQRIYDLNKNGGGEGLEVLNQLKIDIDDLTAMNPAEQFYAIADAMADAGYSAQDMYGALDQLGSDQLGDLASLIKNGSSEMRELVEETMNFSNALSEVDYGRLKTMSEDMVDLEKSIDNSTKKITANMSTAITGMMAGLDRMIKGAASGGEVFDTLFGFAVGAVDGIARYINYRASSIAQIGASVTASLNKMAASAAESIAKITGNQDLKEWAEDAREAGKAYEATAKAIEKNRDEIWSKKSAAKEYWDLVEAEKELAKARADNKAAQDKAGIKKGSSGNNSLEALQAENELQEKLSAANLKSVNERTSAEMKALDAVYALEVQNIENRVKLSEISTEQALQLRLQADKNYAKEALEVERERLDAEINANLEQQDRLKEEVKKTNDKSVKGKEIQAEIVEISKTIATLQASRNGLKQEDLELSDLEVSKMQLKVDLEKQRIELARERQKISAISVETKDEIAANDASLDSVEKQESERYDLRKATIDRMESLEEKSADEIINLQIAAAREHADNLAQITTDRINNEINIEKGRLSELEKLKGEADNSKEEALYEKEIEKTNQSLVALNRELLSIDKDRGALTEAEIYALRTTKVYEEEITKEKEKQSQITSAMYDVQQDYLRATGRETEASINDIDKKYKWLLENLEEGSKDLDLVNKMINIEKAEVNLAKLEKQLDQLQSKYNNGEINYDQFKTGSLDIAGQMEGLGQSTDSVDLLNKTKEAADAVTNSFDRMRQAGEVVGQTLSNDLAGALTDSITGAQSFEDAMTGMLQNIADQLLEMAMNQMITQMMSSMFGGMGGAGGFVGGLASGAMSGGSAGQFHEGGSVNGHGGVSRSWNPAWTSLAPRFHTGGAVLKSDEVPAVLQNGEYVMSKNDPRNPLNGGGQQASQGSGVTVVNTIDDGSIANAMDSTVGHNVMKNVVRSMKNEIKSF